MSILVENETFVFEVGLSQLFHSDDKDIHTISRSLFVQRKYR